MLPTGPNRSPLARRGTSSAPSSWCWPPSGCSTPCSQIQPFMFTRGADGFSGMLNGTAAGNPGWIAHTITWNGSIVYHQPILTNTVFAGIQFLIAFGLIYRRTLRPALALSIVWSVGVWWFGEGLGAVFSGAGHPIRRRSRRRALLRRPGRAAVAERGPGHAVRGGPDGGGRRRPRPSGRSCGCVLALLSWWAPAARPGRSTTSWPT